MFLVIFIFTYIKFLPLTTGIVDGNSGGIGFSGQTHVLYWSDALSEMAFVVPAPSHGMFTSHPSSTGDLNTGMYLNWIY